MKTTLNKILEHKPCLSGWRKLLRALGKNRSDDEPLSITKIIDSNGIEDAVWCLRAVSGHSREIRLFAVWLARQVEHLMTDQRSKDALDVAERFANGQAAKEELAAARAAAREAESCLHRAAMAVVRSSGWSAEISAKWAASFAAEDAAMASESDAALSAARSHELTSEWAAGDADRDVAHAAALYAQAKELRRICDVIDGQEKKS